MNGTHTLAMWTISVTGPLGNEPRDWLRPYARQLVDITVWVMAQAPA